jgi:DNA invertase Pin-like site-specific DNA recombinase
VLIGYARVSTTDQNLDLQRDALAKAGCERIFTDQMSGAKAERPGLEQALSHARAGDTLVVWKLDRLGRSLQHLIETINGLAARDVGFRSLSESIDTTTAAGKLVFGIFGSLAEFERELIRERTNAGLVAARARGRKGGRPRLVDEKKAKAARAMRADTSLSVAEICAELKISRTSFYRYTGEKPASRAAKA